MRIQHVFFLIFFLIFFSCKDSKNENLFLNDDWQFAEEIISTSKENLFWQPATVPGTVQTDLLNLGNIPNPFIGSNENSIQWISKKPWLYKKNFSLSKETLKKRKHFLRFDGLDTYASVYLNDSLILKVNNAFRSWEIDISSIIKPENKLLVFFKSTDSIEQKEANQLQYQLPESPRIFTRKPQFQYGWDWAPTIKTMGIWKDISLISYDNLRFKDVFLQTKTITDSLAQITAQLTINSSEDQEVSIRITNQNTRETFFSTLDIFQNQSEYEIPFLIKTPKLWWTHNLGESFLYDIKIELIKGSKTIETYRKKLGVRSIELVTKKDSIGESFYFSLNGKPVYMKGANIIPQNIFLPEVTQEHYSKLIDDVVAANMNMLRVWGGGIYEDNYFYQLCDANGILVWQDFMFACAMYPGDKNFLENVKQEAIENVKRLRQHPSVALWCGNNENSEGWHRWGWQDGRTEEHKWEIWRHYQKIFNEILPKIVDSLNPSVSYWESSPKYGRGNQRYQYEGDAHDWWVWHDGYPFEHFEQEVPRFMSEFGFQSFPNFETIQYFTKQDSINLNHPSFSTHQKHDRGFALIKEYMARDFPIPVNGEDYVYMSQLLQSHGITKGIHAHRRAKPYNMGTLYWQLNDCWPAVSWSSIDFFGNWKALHYKVKKAYKNVIISTSEIDNEINISIINDTFSEIKDTLTIAHLDFFGNILFEEKQLVTSSVNSSETLFNYSLRHIIFNRNNTFIKLTFGDTEYLHYFARPKDLKLPKEELLVEVTKQDTGFLVKLYSETLQKDVFLYTSIKGKWNDNYFDLLPGKQTEVLFITESKTTPTIHIKTLNQFIQN